MRLVRSRRHKEHSPGVCCCCLAVIWHIAGARSDFTRLCHFFAQSSDVWEQPTITSTERFGQEFSRISIPLLVKLGQLLILIYLSLVFVG